MTGTLAALGLRMPSVELAFLPPEMSTVYSVGCLVSRMVQDHEGTSLAPSSPAMVHSWVSESWPLGLEC